MSEPNDRLDDREIGRLVELVMHEGAADLQPVERKAVQIAEARIAGAEVVERNTHAKRANRADRRDIALRAVEQHRFGDLEFETLRVDAMLRKTRLQRIDQRVVVA